LVGAFDHELALKRHFHRTGESGWDILKSADVTVNVCLKLADFVERAFSQDGEVARVLWQDVSAQRIKALVKPLDLFDRQGLKFLTDKQSADPSLHIYSPTTSSFVPFVYFCEIELPLPGE